MGKVIKNIIFPVLTLIGCYFFYKTYVVLKEGNETYQAIKGIDEKVIEKLSYHRDLQLHYLAVNGEFASEWDSLFNFVRTGVIYTVQETEIIESSPYGDKITVKRDTIGQRLAYDSLKNRLGGIALKDLETLKYTPGHPKDAPVEFFLNAGKARGAAVFEVIDPKPLNPKRQKSKKEGGLPALKVGSMSSASLRGNWEY